MTSREFVLRMAKGYRGRSKSCFSIAKQKVERAMLNQYKSRRLRKRNMRALWIQQINAAARAHDTTYSRMQYGLVAENVLLDRKSLATLAVFEPDSFAAVALLARNKWLQEQGHHFNVASSDHSSAQDHHPPARLSQIVINPDQNSSRVIMADGSTSPVSSRLIE